MSDKGSRFAVLAAAVLGLALATASDSFGQVIRSRPLKDNPYRGPGGACMYGKDGALLHAPVGVDCPDREDHLRGDRPAAPPPVLEGFPPALRGGVSELYRDHAHIGDELLRVRKAIQSGDGSAALLALDKLGTEVADHRTREEALLEKLASERAAR